MRPDPAPHPSQLLATHLSVDGADTDSCVAGFRACFGANGRVLPRSGAQLCRECHSTIVMKVILIVMVMMAVRDSSHKLRMVLIFCIDISIEYKFKVTLVVIVIVIAVITTQAVLVCGSL